MTTEGKVVNAQDYLGQEVEVKIDRPAGRTHPGNDIYYPINYGFIPDTISGDGEELDAYVLGVTEPLEQFCGRCIAMIHRTNDDDDKLIVTDGTEYSDAEIKKATHFQEQYFKSVIIRES